MLMVTAVRITDPHILAAIEAEQGRTGEATATKTAARLIIERLAQKEFEELKRQPIDPVESIAQTTQS